MDPSTELCGIPIELRYAQLRSLSSPSRAHLSIRKLAWFYARDYVCESPKVDMGVI